MQFCPSVLVLATKIAFSIAELRDVDWKPAGASVCPLHSLEMQGQPLLLGQATRQYHAPAYIVSIDMKALVESCQLLYLRWMLPVQGKQGQQVLHQAHETEMQRLAASYGKWLPVQMYCCFQGHHSPP